MSEFTVGLSELIVLVTGSLIAALHTTVIVMLRREREERTQAREENLMVHRDLWKSITELTKVTNDNASRLSAHIDTKHSIRFNAINTDMSN